MEKLERLKSDSSTSDKIKLTIINLQSDNQYEEIIETLVDRSTQNNIKPELVFSMLAQESVGKRDAQSGVGALGLIQLMPCTAMDRGMNVDPSSYTRNSEDRCINTNQQINIDGANDDRLDPIKNLEGGIKHIAFLNNLKVVTNYNEMLIAYNWGQGNLEDYKNGEKSLPDEPRNYVDYINSYYSQISS